MKNCFIDCSQSIWNCTFLIALQKLLSDKHLNSDTKIYTGSSSYVHKFISMIEKNNTKQPKHCFSIKVFCCFCTKNVPNMCGSRGGGGQGVRASPEKSQKYRGFLAILVRYHLYTCNHKLYKSAFSDSLAGR